MSRIAPFLRVFASSRETLLFPRHAELVSASIPPTFPIDTIAPWTLKQVQGDGYIFNERD